MLLCVPMCLCCSVSSLCDLGEGGYIVEGRILMLLLLSLIVLPFVLWYLGTTLQDALDLETIEVTQSAS